jgi:7-carboxy-7-deazaguanine synthase
MPDKILISEVFGPVVQGEGPVIGRRTIFVRTFGCDSRCIGLGKNSGCDTMYAVDTGYPGAETRQLLSVDEIIQRVEILDHGLKLPITISGGNPVLWDLAELISALHKLGHEVWIETQGTVWRDWLTLCDNVVVSPKGPGMNDIKHGILPPTKLKIFVDKVVRLYFKVVVFSPADLDYAEMIIEAYPPIPMYLSVGSPVGFYDKSEINDRIRMVIEWVLERPGLREAIVLPQMHALAYGGRRGV